jgi:ATP-dependent Clp protease ATP-binding subunit ClpB
VQDPLAEMLLAGDVRDGSTVKISASKDGLTFNGKKPPSIDEDEDLVETV